MDRTRDKNSFAGWGLRAFIGALIVAGLYASSLYSYLFFHSLIELFSVVTAFVIFVIIWHTRRIQDNQYLLLIGIASLSAGSIELVHTLAYKGMGVFSGSTANLATELWIAFRYVFSASFLLAPFFIKRSIGAKKILLVFGTVTVAVLSAVFSGLFPDCFVDGSGLTPFKIFSEYVITAIFAAGLGLLIQNRKFFDRTVFGLMAGSIVFSVASELAFTTYVSVFGQANMIGHFFLLASMGLIYRAIVITGIVDPSHLLFRDLKRSEAAIRESEERYRTLVEFSPLAIMVHSRNIWLYVNPAGLRLFGASSPDDLIGTSVLDRIHADFLPIVRERIQRVEQEEGRVELRELMMLRLDGTAIDVESAAVRTTYRGEPAAQVIVKDVTDRKKAERALEKSRAELSAMIEKVPLVTLLMDRERRVRKANAAALSFSGRTEADMVGHRGGEALHCIHSHDAPLGCGFGPSCASCMVRQSVLDVFERGISRQGVETALSFTRNGRQDDRAMILTTTPITLENEQLALVCLEDITERKRAGDALREKEERLRLFIEHAPAALAMFDCDMRYVSASRRWMSDYGIGNQPLTGRSHYEVFPEISEQWKAFHRRGLSGEVVKLDDDRFERADGKIQWLRWEIHPWHDAEGAVAGIVIITEDITERKNAEMEVRSLNDELKTNLLLLEAANRELEAFSYSVSHDLRAPLRSIDGFTQAIQEEYADRLDAAGQDYLQRVRAAAGKMAQLIDALLNLSRLTRGDISLAPVNLSALAVSIAEDLKKSDPIRDVRINIAEGLIADGDPVMLRAALENLLGNAWKFSARRATARVDFGMQQTTGKPVFFVRDNGAGFDMVNVNKLFAPFQRLHPGKEYPGIGIGLATVQRIIHRHGGEIWAEAEPDKGATFYFTL